MPKTSAGLEFVLSARGADGVVREIGRVGQGVQEAQKATGRGASGWQKWQSGIRQATGAARGLWHQMRGIAALTGIGAGIGFASLAKEIMDAEDASIALRFQADKTKEEWVNIDAAIERMRSTTGKSKVELLNLLDVIDDFGVGFEDALTSMEDMIAFAKLLRVDTEQAAKAVGAIAKATGGKVGSREGMAILAAAAKAAGGDEGAFLESASKTIRMMEGASAEDIQRVLQVQAGAGQEFMKTGGHGEVDTVFMAMKSLETLNAKEKRALGGNLGESGAETMLNLASLLKSDAAALDRMPISDSVKLIAKAMAENSDVVNKVGQAAADSRGKLDDFGVALDEAKNSMGTGAAGLTEQLKQQFEPMVRGALGWMIDHRAELQAAFQTLGAMLKGTAGALAWLGKIILDVVTTFATLPDALKELLGIGPKTHVESVRITDPKAAEEAYQAYVRGGLKGRSELLDQTMSAYGARRSEVLTDQQTARNRATRAANQANLNAFVAANPGAPEAVRGGLAAVSQAIVNIVAHFSPETVHTTADAEINGQRRPATVNAE